MSYQNTPEGSQHTAFDQGRYGEPRQPLNKTSTQAKIAELWCCPKDNTVNTGEYCSTCGFHKPILREASMVCRKCGYQNGKAATFCAGCGRNLSQPTEPETQKKSIPAGLTIGLIVGGCGILMAVCLICVLLLGKASDLPRVTTPPPGQAPAHTHSWAAATCTDPKTCRTCGATSGSAKGHQWEDATCVDPKTCSVCKVTIGSALGHQWEDASCIDPKTCSVCKETIGSALGHQWAPATTTQPETCRVCGATRGDVLNPFSDFDVGDRFTFGEYAGESIDWLVLDEEDGRILVMSLYGLECIKYDDQNSSDRTPNAVSWNECSLRSWLNTNFYNSAFDRDERSYILADDELGDNVFILSEAQVRNYMPTNAQRVCSVTGHAAENHAYGWWWLRTDSAVSKTANVNSNGKIDHTRVNGINGTVRPVIWIRTD